MGFLSDRILSLLLPIIAGPIVFLVVQGMKRAWGWLDRQPGLVKQGLAIAVAALLTAAYRSLGVVPPDGCGTVAAYGVTDACWVALQGDWVKAVVSALLAMALHNSRKLKSG